MMARYTQNLRMALKEDRHVTPVPEQAHLPTGLPGAIAVCYELTSEDTRFYSYILKKAPWG